MMAYLDEIERRREAVGQTADAYIDWVVHSATDLPWTVSIIRRAEELFAIHMPRQTDSEVMKWSADVERGPPGGGGGG